MNIYLIGMPGCGKSTVGKTLAKKSEYQYVDLDKYIETKNSKTIPDIFNEVGEVGFRQLEQDALKDFSEKDNYIVSCGGGIISNSENKKLMNGKVIYIDVPIKSLKKRLASDAANARPMFKTKTVEELYKERKDQYNYFMDYKVYNHRVNDCVKKILELVSEKMKKILVINGPNLNMLGKRDENQYGAKTLEDIYNMIKAENYFEYEFFQSNHEGAIIDKIQQYKCDAIIINAGAYTHTSIALHDCLEIVKVPKVEVHLSDVDNREDFRKVNFIRSVCDKTISGLREQSYIEAIKYLKKTL